MSQTLKIMIRCFPVDRCAC